MFKNNKKTIILLIIFLISLLFIKNNKLLAEGEDKVLFTTYLQDESNNKIENISIEEFNQKYENNSLLTLTISVTNLTSDVSLGILQGYIKYYSEYFEVPTGRGVVNHKNLMVDEYGPILYLEMEPTIVEGTDYLTFLFLTDEEWGNYESNGTYGVPINEETFLIEIYLKKIKDIDKKLNFSLELPSDQQGSLVGNSTDKTWSGYELYFDNASGINKVQSKGFLIGDESIDPTADITDISITGTNNYENTLSNTTENKYENKSE